MPESEKIADILDVYREWKHDLNVFMEGVVKYVGTHPQLTCPGKSIVHSYKYRLKDEGHLAGKIARKNQLGRNINTENLFREITDLAGARILHLYQSDFAYIDEVIRKRISNGDWVLSETPSAYTWDPESAEFFKKFDLKVLEKPTSYTSVHYLIRPRQDSRLCCEVQVRTLFEEIWGEVDHQMNYPNPSDNVACREQIKVLSKIVGAGSRLLESLQRVQSNDV